MPTSSLVRLERRGPVAHVVLDRAEAHNAVNLALRQTLHAAVQACAGDADVRAVLLRAEGTAFCVGGDAEPRGRITQAVPDGELAAWAAAMADRLATGPAQAHGALAAATFDRDFTAQTEAEAAEIARLSGGADAREGLAAFWPSGPRCSKA